MACVRVSVIGYLSVRLWACRLTVIAGGRGLHWQQQRRSFEGEPSEMSAAPDPAPLPPRIRHDRAFTGSSTWPWWSDESFGGQRENFPWQGDISWCIQLSSLGASLERGGRGRRGSLITNLVPAMAFCRGAHTQEYKAVYTLMRADRTAWTSAARRVCFSVGVVSTQR